MKNAHELRDILKRDLELHRGLDNAMTKLDGRFGEETAHRMMFEVLKAVGEFRITVKVDD